MLTLPSYAVCAASRQRRQISTAHASVVFHGRRLRVTKTLSASAAVVEAAHQATRHDKREYEGDLDGETPASSKDETALGVLSIHQHASITIRGKSDIYRRDEVENPFIGCITSLPKVC
jgi:hypothetical protein